MNTFEKLTELIENNGLTYSIVTYGCQMNEHESEKLAGILEGIGYMPALAMESADFIIFNTCCIRENAEHKIFGNVGALKNLKQERKELLIAVCGCMTQQEEVAKKLFRTFPFVDIVLGTHNTHELASMIEKRLLEQKRVFAVEQHDGCISEQASIKRNRGPLASVNIMYGCNNFCSYCIVPYVRGRERSRDAAHILREIDGLVTEGYREITLLGQNVNSYHGEGAADFPVLLQQICDNTKIERIRFMTSHPKDLSPALVDVIAKNKQICKHIHLPVQSGSSAVLKAMNRGYTREGYLKTIETIRTAMPDIAITTDIIVGFPGETEQDFKGTMTLLEQVRFDAAFTFVYSKREGTAAANMSNQVPQPVQSQRIVELIALQNEITEGKNRAYVGKTLQVLVESTSTRDENHVCGRTDSSRMVNFAGTAQMIGSFQNIRITEAKRTTLFGQLV